MKGFYDTPPRLQYDAVLEYREETICTAQNNNFSWLTRATKSLQCLPQLDVHATNPPDVEQIDHPQRGKHLINLPCRQVPPRGQEEPLNPTRGSPHFSQHFVKRQARWSNAMFKCSFIGLILLLLILTVLASLLPLGASASIVAQPNLSAMHLLPPPTATQSVVMPHTSHLPTDNTDMTTKNLNHISTAKTPTATTPTTPTTTHGSFPPQYLATIPLPQIHPHPLPHITRPSSVVHLARAIQEKDDPLLSIFKQQQQQQPKRQQHLNNSSLPQPPPWSPPTIPSTPRPTKASSGLEKAFEKVRTQDLLRFQTAQQHRKYSRPHHLHPTYPVPISPQTPGINWSIHPLPMNAAGYRFVASRRVFMDAMTGVDPSLASERHHIESNSQIFVCYADFIPMPGDKGSDEEKRRNNDNDVHKQNNTPSTTTTTSTLPRLDEQIYNPFHQPIALQRISPFITEATHTTQTTTPPLQASEENNTKRTPPYQFGCVSHAVRNLAFERTTTTTLSMHNASQNGHNTTSSRLYDDRRRRELLRFLGKEDGRLFTDRCGRILMSYTTLNDRHPEILDKLEREVRYVDLRRFLPDLPITILPTPECQEQDHIYYKEYQPMAEYFLWELEFAKQTAQAVEGSVQEEEQNENKLLQPQKNNAQTTQEHRQQPQQKEDKKTPIQTMPILHQSYNIPRINKNWVYLPVWGIEGVQYAHDIAALYHTYGHHFDKHDMNEITSNNTATQHKQDQHEEHQLQLPLHSYHITTNRTNHNNATTDILTTEETYNNAFQAIKQQYPLHHPSMSLPQHPRALPILFSSSPRAVLLGPHIIAGSLNHTGARRHAHHNNNNNGTHNHANKTHGHDQTRGDDGDFKLLRCALHYYYSAFSSPHSQEQQHKPTTTSSSRPTPRKYQLHSATNALLFRLHHKEYVDIITATQPRNNNNNNNFNKDNRTKDNTQVLQQQEQQKQQHRHGEDLEDDHYYYIYAHVVHLRPNGHTPVLVFMDAMTLEPIAITLFEVNNLDGVLGHYNFSGFGGHSGAAGMSEKQKHQQQHQPQKQQQSTHQQKQPHKPRVTTYAHSLFANKTPWTLNPQAMRSPMVLQSYTLDDQVFVAFNHNDVSGVVQELDMRRLWDVRLSCGGF